MRRIEELSMAETADGTLFPIRAKDPLSKRLLMDSLERRPRHVPSTHICRKRLIRRTCPEETVAFFDEHGEAETPRIVLDNIGRPVSYIPPRNDSV
jgi:hypothetical protein